MTLCIDRIEGTVAVCEQEDGSRTDILLSLLPAGVREGDLLIRKEDGSFTISRDETARRRAAAIALQNKLFGKRSD